MKPLKSTEHSNKKIINHKGDKHDNKIIKYVIERNEVAFLVQDFKD